MFNMATRCRVGIVALTLALALSVFQTQAFASTDAGGGGGNVLPPTARPHGFSLTRAAVATAVFNTTTDSKGNHIGDPPDFPFKMLAITSTNTFEVDPGTQLYVPLAQADDSPPIVGHFPTSSSQAPGYFFGSSELGGHDLSIAVDGKTTRIGPEFLVGPVTTSPLGDGGGTHYMTLAVFLTPFTAGNHTVTIVGHFDGAALLAFPEFFPGGKFDFSISYAVQVATSN
jgi:hypothetical protein